MDFNNINSSAFHEIMENDANFKMIFEAKIKEKLLAALDDVDVSKILNKQMENMIYYMLTDDSYVYENVRDMVSTILEDNIRISFGRKEVFSHDEESIVD